MIIENEDSDILIAYDTKIIGLALVQKQKTPPYNCLVEHNFAYLMDFVVEPVFRNKGIGKKLIESVKKWALEKDCKYIELNVLSQNDKAIALYKAMDFDEEMKTMRMKL
ncbi:GNAT family N-acetyltransferase [Thomasclavelia cocleata]|nr:GNAT family N-acetyltransferase [Thomasclavelia cocleata]